MGQRLGVLGNTRAEAGSALALEETTRAMLPAPPGAEGAVVAWKNGSG